MAEDKGKGTGLGRGQRTAGKNKNAANGMGSIHLRRAVKFREFKPSIRTFLTGARPGPEKAGRKGLMIRVVELSKNQPNRTS
ncbi:MAG: hypothetical protein HWE23_01630 [Rhodobacteraceae bacterium]|nr:hypothetical protein [Paracoccaceae bacterium]